jgi:hypothetical protein
MTTTQVREVGRTNWKRSDMKEQLDSLEQISKKLEEHDEKFSRQYDATDDLMKRVAALERKLGNLEKRGAA